MFDHLVESSPVRKKSKRFAYFVGTAAVWVAVLTAALAAGVVAYDASLDEVYTSELMFLPRLPVQLGPRGNGTPPKVSKQAGRLQSLKAAPIGIPAPRNIPPAVGPVNLTRDGDIGSGPWTGTGSGDPNGVPDGIPVANSDAGNTPEPPPVTVEPKREVQPVTQQLRMSKGVLQGSAIRKIEPLYPELARKAGIFGQVLVEVVIDEQGNVKSARAVSGHMLLKQVAEDAARRWKWNPTFLSGVPVQVVGSIVFNFNIR
jgi:protein TonB